MTPFQLKDTSLSCGATNLDTLQNPAAAIKTATYGKVEFTTQNNAVQGEMVIHGTSGDTLLCLKIALVRGVLYFREQGDAPSQNLATFNRGVIWVNTTPVDISRVLKYAVRFLGPSLGFTPKEISLKSLRKAGARAILCSGVKTNIIKLMGRW